MDDIIFVVELANWEKWNPKRAQKTYSWLRLDNDALTSQDLHKVNAEGRLLWIYLLCQASKKNGAPFKLNLDFVCDSIMISQKAAQRALEIFMTRGMIVVNALSLHRTNPQDTTTTPTNERTNETNERTEIVTEVETSANINEKLFDDLINPILEKVPRDAQDAWVQTYENPDWVKNELKKAVSWCKSNPRKAPKSSYARFFNSWLARGWEVHRKTLPTSIVEVRPLEKCMLCVAGLVRATNRSNGNTEWTSCLCPAGKLRTTYIRFDENRFERSV